MAMNITTRIRVLRTDTPSISLAISARHTARQPIIQVKFYTRDSIGKSLEEK
jgi:hypothetical protein